MLVDHRVLWLAQTNCWVMAREVGGQAVIIDAPPDPVGIDALLAVHRLTPVALLLTHGHIDHMGAAEHVRRSGTLTYVHPDDDFLTSNPRRQLMALFGAQPPGDVTAPAITERLVHGAMLHLAGFDIEVRHTPGHTPGHCCFHVEDEGLLFSGDQLFAGSIGRTDLPGGDMAALMRSMKDRVLDLPDTTDVLPGHGPATTIGAERRHNPYLSHLGDRA